MSVDVLDAVYQRRQAQARGYCPHKPHPQQAKFLALDCIDALYGGAAGGGKSDALLMGALQYVHIPGYAALILRRTYADLRKADAIMARAAEWLGPTDAKWDAVAHTWRFPSGATLEFGYFDTERNKDNYQGGAWQCICIDEETQWPESWARYLFSRLRKPKVGPLSKVPLRFRAATNPGGIGHEWVRRRYVDPVTATAPFIPAKLDDNPSLDAETYRVALAALDATTRQQLEHGVWVRDANGLVYKFDESRNMAPLPHDIRLPWSHVLALDFGVKDATSFTVLAYRDTDPKVYVRRSFRATGMITDDAAKVIAELNAEYSFSKMVGDIGGQGKLWVEELRRRFSLPVEPAEKELIDEWVTLPWADEAQQKEADGFDNHCADGALYGWRACPNFAERAPDPPLTPLQIIEQDVVRMFPQAQDGYEPKQFWEEGTKWK